jgi:hypothetical protein
VCWDALDGSTLFELIAQANVSYQISFAARVLICFWYFSVGIRIAMMSITFLSPSSYLYRLFLHPALSWSPEPTVDRTLSGLFLRSNIALVMIFPQIYAAILRLYLLLTGTLSFLQQELMFKNLLFLYTVINVIITRSMIKQRNWNTRELIDVTIPYLQQRLHWIKPSRAVQIEVLRYLFIATYLLIGALLSSILIEVTPGSTLWVNNVASDIICCIIFFFLCRRAHNPTVLVPTDSVLSSFALSPLLSQTVRFGFFSPFALLSFWVFFFCSISLLLAFLLSTGACPHPYQPPTLTRLSLSSPLSLSLSPKACQ